MLSNDLAYASRALRNSPVFTLTAAATIALGIGASTAIFSVTNAVLLRPLPYKNPDRLVLVSKENRNSNTRSFLFSNADFFDLRDGTRSAFEEMAGVFTFRAFVTREDGSAEQISKAQVTTNFFHMLGAAIAIGRDFDSADGQAQPQEASATLPVGSVAILSHEYWQRRYAGNIAVIGEEMLGSGRRGPRIVGVLAPGFRLLLPSGAATDTAPDVWIANNTGYDNARRNMVGLRVVGTLRNGVTLASARERLPADNSMYLRLEPLHGHLVAEVRPAILALMGAVIFLLLIACANVANLLLVRAWSRDRQFAVCAALGASRWRIARQMLAEALLISAAGTVAGLGLAWAGMRRLLAIAPANLPRLESVALDWHVLGFAAVAGLAAVAVFGTAPALRAARPCALQVLRAGVRSAGPGTGRWLRNGVVISEVALSFVLLTGSGLMFRSFLALRQLDPGYDARGVLTFFLVRDWNFASPPQQRTALLREIQERLRALPGVESAAASVFFPLTGGTPVSVGWATGGTRTERDKPQAEFQTVLPGYFETLRTRLLAGRTFTQDDDARGRNVAVIDRLLAAKAFPNESAVGKRLFVPLPNAEWVEVIGVVAHQSRSSLAETGREQIYLTEGFAGFGVGRYWALRTAGDPASFAAAVREAISQFDRQLVITKMEPMRALLDRAQAGTRFSLLLIGAFAAVAALLAAVGLYGVLSSVVRQRTAEIGVRMALGAAPGGIFRLVAGHGLRLSAAGIALGLFAALVLTRSMKSMLIGVTAADPATYAGVAALFLLIAALACWAPASRAAALSPTDALRED